MKQKYSHCAKAELSDIPTLLYFETSLDVCAHVIHEQGPRKLGQYIEFFEILLGLDWIRSIFLKRPLNEPRKKVKSSLCTVSGALK